MKSYRPFSKISTDAECFLHSFSAFIIAGMAFSPVPGFRPKSAILIVKRAFRLHPEMSERNRECEVIMKTVKKINEKKKPTKTPKQPGNTGFFSQRPRAANILFMEDRIKEMFPQGATPEDYKNNLKNLLNEWKELDSEKRMEFEKKAEQELFECYVN